MNPAYVHLALNIFPPVLNVAAIVVLAVGILWKSHAVLRTSCALLILSALFSIPVYLSGEQAEHLVEKLDGINEVAIHPHEEAAEWAYYILLGQGVVALAMLVAFRRRDLAQWAVAMLVLVALVSTAAVFRAAFLGGTIHHPETAIPAAMLGNRESGVSRSHGLTVSQSHSLRVSKSQRGFAMSNARRIGPFETMRL